jgi:hypothetical protein
MRPRYPVPMASGCRGLFIMSYVSLKCGHFTTKELSDIEQPIHRLGTPRTKKLWCESCNKWVAVQQPKKPSGNVFTDERPLF